MSGTNEIVFSQSLDTDLTRRLLIREINSQQRQSHCLVSFFIQTRRFQYNLKYFIKNHLLYNKQN